MKLPERLLDSYIHKMLNIDEMQFVIVPGRGTTDAIFVVRHQQEYIAANTLLYFAFVDLEEAPRSCAKENPTVGLKEPWCGGIGCVCHPGHILSRVVCGSMVSTVTVGVWELVSIRTLSLANCSSSWYWGRFRVSSALVCHGSSSMLMTVLISDNQVEYISKLKA